MTPELWGFLLGATAVCFLCTLMLMLLLGAGRWQEYRRRRAALDRFLKTLGSPARSQR